MTDYYSILYEDIRQERSLILLLTLTDLDLLKKGEVMDHEVGILKN